MKSSMSRILIEALVRKTIRDIKESPERSTRNLIDMGLQFSEGRFQKHLFQTVQNMLTNQDSAYYGLVQDTIVNVDEERLLNFGMNLGYNSCTLGAATIREIEAQKGYNIPWNIIFEFDKQQFHKYRNRYYRLIGEGEELGVFSYMIKVEGNPFELIPLIAEYPDSAFFLFSDKKFVTEEFVNELTFLTNVMILINCDEESSEICEVLREKKLLYGMYKLYSDKDVADIIEGIYWKKAEKEKATAMVMMSDENCSKEAMDIVSKQATQERFSQKYQSIAWELYNDNCFIDEVISDDACYVYFDKQGRLCGINQKKKPEENNLFDNELRKILMRVFYKEK